MNYVPGCELRLVDSEPGTWPKAICVSHTWEPIPNNHNRVTIVNHKRRCKKCGRVEVKWSMFHDWEVYPV